MYRIGFILLLIFSKVAAQDLSFKWSEKVPAKGIIKYCGTSANHFFTSQIQDARTVLLRRFDSALQLKKDDTLVLTNKNEEYLTSFATDSHFVHVIVQRESRKQTNILLIKTSLQNPLQATTTVVGVFKDGYRGIVFAYYSQDKSKLLITNFNFVAKTLSIDRDFVVINTASGNVQFTGNTSIQGFNDHIGVTNNGLVWLNAEQIYSKQIRLLEKTKTQQKIVFISSDNKANEYIIRFDTKYTPGVDIIEGEGSDLYVTGFAYDNDSKASRLSESELFIYTVDSEKGTVTDSSFTSFSGLYPDGRIKVDDRLPYTLKSIYKRNDGGYTLLAEQYQFISGQYSATFKYNDLACIQLSKGFKFESVARIPKVQYGTDNPSFLSTVIGDTVYLIYNDLTVNLNAVDDNLSYPSNKQSKNALFLVTINKNGKFRKEVIYDYASGKPIPQILSSFVLNSHTMYLAADAQVGILIMSNQNLDDK
jgi:hypothetical protein